MTDIRKWNVHNACSDACDNDDGPCACGAWHTPADFFERVKKQHGSSRAREYLNERESSALKE